MSFVRYWIKQTNIFINSYYHYFHSSIVNSIDIYLNLYALYFFLPSLGLDEYLRMLQLLQKKMSRFNNFLKFWRLTHGGHALSKCDISVWITNVIQYKIPWNFAYLQQPCVYRPGSHTHINFEDQLNFMRCLFTGNYNAWKEW